ncbi:Glycolate oxidase FAD binding subunit [Pseudomonas coronafaciens pv. garcae]|nr:Glycolate oxidase FAD binding subunit [Pseudomonas coronafaciens pv. garcae]
MDSPFQPLPEPLLRYHRALKNRLDPQGIFNPGRLYAEL